LQNSFTISHPSTEQNPVLSYTKLVQ